MEFGSSIVSQNVHSTAPDIDTHNLTLMTQYCTCGSNWMRSNRYWWKMFLHSFSPAKKKLCNDPHDLTTIEWTCSNLKVCKFFCTFFCWWNPERFFFIIIKIAGITRTFAFWYKRSINLQEKQLNFEYMYIHRKYKIKLQLSSRFNFTSW